MEIYADSSKWQLEPFDLNRAKRGDLVCTLNGMPVCLDLENIDPKASFPLVGFADGYPCEWKLSGANNYGLDKTNDFRLFHPVPVKVIKTKKVPFDFLRVNEEGVKVVCETFPYQFEEFLKMDLKDTAYPIVAVVFELEKNSIFTLFNTVKMEFH